MDGSAVLAYNALLGSEYRLGAALFQFQGSFETNGKLGVYDEIEENRPDARRPCRTDARRLQHQLFTEQL